MSKKLKEISPSELEHLRVHRPPGSPLTIIEHFNPHDGVKRTYVRDLHASLADEIEELIAALESGTATPEQQRRTAELLERMGEGR